MAYQLTDEQKAFCREKGSLSGLPPINTEEEIAAR